MAGEDRDFEVKDIGDVEPVKPGGMSGEIWDLLEDGKSEEEVTELGFNKRTVDIVAFNMEKAGARVRPKKERKSKKGKNGGADHSDVSTVRTGDRGSAVEAMVSTNKPTTPEALIETLNLNSAGMNGLFTAGVKMGMSLVVLGVRVAQELSSVGVQQARPLIAMSKEMRAGEIAAAQVASKETAIEMAGNIQDYFGPALSELGSRVDDMSRPKVAEGPDPMKSMMVRTFEPIMQQMIGGLLPGFQLPAGKDSSGWERTKK